jgi:hypothetical protein
MAEIKVNIKGDDSDIKAKFRETSAEARAFQESVTKSMEAIGAASKNVISESGLGGIAKLLGAAGLTGAAIEFSHNLVQGFKDAVGAALDFGKQVGQLKSALGGTFGGQAEYWANQIRTISGAMGSFEANMTVFKGLLRGGLVPQDAFKTLIDIQNAAKTLGVDVGELGEKFAEIKERPEEMSRFFRTFPQLAPMTRAMGGGEQPTVDWMFRTLLPGIAPGGLQAPIRLGAQASVGGQIATQGEEFRKNWIELGQQLLPVVNEALRDLKTEMPDITAAFHALAMELKAISPGVIKGIHFLIDPSNPKLHPFGEPLKPISDFLSGIEDQVFKRFSPANKDLQDTHRSLSEAADKLSRSLNPH